MRLLALLILLGILVLLFLAAIYFARSQKTSNQHSGSALEDLYRSKGMGNIFDARNRIDEIVPYQKRRSSSGRHQHSRHEDHE